MQGACQAKEFNRKQQQAGQCQSRRRMETFFDRTGHRDTRAGGQTRQIIAPTKVLDSNSFIVSSWCSFATCPTGEQMP